MASRTNWAGSTFSVPGTGCGMNCPLSFFCPADLHGVDRFYVAVLIALESRGGGQVDARVGPELGSGLFLAVVDLVGLGPFRPGIVGGPLIRRARHDLQLDDRAAAMAEGGADAIGAGIAAADDDHVLALGGDELTAPGQAVPWCWRSRKSMAKWMPFRLRPSIGRSRGRVAPVASTTASNSLRSFSAG